MEGKSAFGIDRKSSIESEPRTLSIEQIQCAREAALCVLSTRSLEEAMRIFTEGLEPVVSVAADKIGDMNKEMEYLQELHLLSLEEEEEEEERDVVSAPF